MTIFALLLSTFLQDPPSPLPPIPPPPTTEKVTIVSSGVTFGTTHDALAAMIRASELKIGDSYAIEWIAIPLVLLDIDPVTGEEIEGFGTPISLDSVERTSTDGTEVVLFPIPPGTQYLPHNNRGWIIQTRLYLLPRDVFLDSDQNLHRPPD